MFFVQLLRQCYFYNSLTLFFIKVCLIDLSLDVHTMVDDGFLLTDFFQKMLSKKIRWVCSGFLDNPSLLDHMAVMPLAGGQSGLQPKLEFESLVNPITTRGADYTHHITASPPGFENPAASLHGTSQLFQLKKLVRLLRIRKYLARQKPCQFVYRP